MQAEEQVVPHHLTLHANDSAFDVRIQLRVQAVVPQLLQCVVVLQDALDDITSHSPECSNTNTGPLVSCRP